MRNKIQHQLDMQLQYGAPHPPFHEEHTFYDLVAAGDIGAIEQLKAKYGTPRQEIASEKGTLSDDPLRNAIYHLVVNCTIITRTCMSAGMPQEEGYTLSDLFIRRADRCKTVEQVHQLNDEMAVEFAQRMKKLHEYPKLSPAVRRAVNFIHDNLGQRLSAEMLAAVTGYSRSYLATLFKKETGLSITEFILKTRIATAVSMLENGVRLSEIASALGFSSQSHFCARFRQVTGCTPSEYKRR